jgi:hypothetical protein
LSDSFPIQNGLKQGDAPSPLLFNFKEVGLEVNIKKIRHTLLSLHQNVGQNRDIKIANRSYENESQFKCLGTQQQIKICLFVSEGN